MKVAVTGLLALAALVAGGWAMGWQGVVLVLTVLVFLLLLQFSKLMKVMRQAGSAPIGQVANAVMFHSRLQPGQALVDVLALAGSLGEAVPEQVHTYRWRDAAGDEVHLRFDAGSRLLEATLQRAS